LTERHKHTNSLIDESSPYLLQHAHNPVNWFPWRKETFELATKENKLLLISIGYSACHWCHVMEHESFEDEMTAGIMNEGFINIKVDREERPDIDQIYVHAVQLMTGHAGWPLNCIVLPDGRPVYGGTYFQKEQWQHILTQLGNLWKNNREKMLEYAENLMEGLKRPELLTNQDEGLFSFNHLKDALTHWKSRFDMEEGGPRRAPKFPLPNNYLFLMQYAIISGDEEVLHHVELTLSKIACGGIYDQIGGGFSRYSTDLQWKVPHFEKMLYDNAQLISLYSQAYRCFGQKSLYKEIVYETIRFVKRELFSAEGSFFSALDADTEGEEGKYYTWTKDELQKVLKDKFNRAEKYFKMNQGGYWEHDKYILLREEEIEDSAKELTEIKKILFSAREKRKKPGTDDKSLTSWNALMTIGLSEAFRTFGEGDFLTCAVENGHFIRNKLLRKDGGLFHSYKSGNSQIEGFLEDYAFTIEAFISLYQSTFEEQWLFIARNLADYCIIHFYEADKDLFYFTSDMGEKLILRKEEITDGVIPSSSSSIAKSLFLLARYFGENRYQDISKNMLKRILPMISSYPEGYSNWSILLLYFTSSFYEIAIVGKDVEEKHENFSKLYLPNVIFAGSRNQSTLPLLFNRYVQHKTFIYVCENNSCKIPVENIDEAIALL